jgi:iron only hydrogenase large subunit-like protein
VDKNNIPKIEKELKKKTKMVALVAPSFITDFDYPSILTQLKKLGFDKSVELTFGAKMVNREYHKQLKNSKKLLIASTCPGIVETIKLRYPKYVKNLAKIDSPMIATGKICRKIYPKHKTVFLSPCDYKKLEAQKSKHIDYVIDYEQLGELFKKHKIKKSKDKKLFDKFYNDYTKIYPLEGGLAKTAHLKGIIRKDEIKSISGIKKVMKFLDNPDPKIRFLDVLFCVGGCIGGPKTTKKLTIAQKKKKVLSYLEKSKKEDIPKGKKGTLEKAKGIKFTY